MAKSATQWMDLIDCSFMGKTFKEQYKAIITERIQRLQR
jgi:hypothetical protein